MCHRLKCFFVDNSHKEKNTHFLQKTDTCVLTTVSTSAAAAVPQDGMFRGLIRPTTGAIPWLYHTLLTRMTQNPGGGPLIHPAASYAACCKLGGGNKNTKKKQKNLLLKYFPGT